jgi:hypothetical protein
MCCFGLCDKKIDESGESSGPPPSDADGEKAGSLFDSVSREERDAGPNIPGVIGRRRRIRRLHCKTGFDVAVYPNGKVRGTQSPRNKYGMILSSQMAVEND